MELIFGTWVRPMGIADLGRFSIPVGVHFEFDASALYGGDAPQMIHYSRDGWGLRGRYGAVEAIDVLTIGGSTTEQRYLDDGATWQSVAQSRLRQTGPALAIANAGVDGQSTVGHLFNFDYWFPLIPGLRPQIVLFYLGANDVLRHDQRAEFDDTVNGSSWRVRSATYQLLRMVKGNFRARSVGVLHGRRRELSEQDFTDTGLLTEERRRQIADTMTNAVLRNAELLRQRAIQLGAMPVFATQTALGWSADPDGPVRGLRDEISVHGATVNYADVSFLHRELNRRLLAYCRATEIVCFDLAGDIQFDPGDYYDYLHNTPAGAEKVGAYLALRLRELRLTPRTAP